MNLDQTIELWYHYEEIAMHFNQLIIQYRLQLMGGVGIIGALSGYLIGSKVEDDYMRHKLRFLISTGLLFLFIAAAILDLFYYNELLRGAVKALIEFEKCHPELYMSTYIKNQFNGSASTIIYISYSTVLIPLVCFTGWSGYEYFKERKNKRCH